jgi:hypothetical protein
MLEKEIRFELDLLVQEIALVKFLDESNKEFVYNQMVLLRNESPLFNQNSEILKDHYYRWLKVNIYGNKLPYPSSGSFLSAVEDYDNNLQMLGQDVDDDDMVDLFDMCWGEMIG